MSTSNGHATAPIPTSATGGITEDEAALYDRQLRLWGVEAQNRMRNASVLIVNFRAVAAEIAKNIVLAGVGKVTLLDPKDVQEEDLGGNFFLREEEVGHKRVEAGAPRVQALNPRVQLLTEIDPSKLEGESFLSQFDLVVLTDVDAATLQRINTLTRKLNKKLYAASSVGIDGWIFADLLEHEFVVDLIKPTAPGETSKVPTKRALGYAPFETILSHSWASAKPRELRKTQANLWGTLVLFEHQRSRPELELGLEGLKQTARNLLPRLGVKVELLPDSVLSRICSTASFEFPPSAAIIGGVAGQDVLNVLGGKEEPVRNLMVFDGEGGQANVWALGL